MVEGLNRPPTCDELAAEWSERVRLVSDEYGPALHSLSLGLRPPVTGWFNNWFLDGSAAMERALLWGCIAPGDPTRAAALACEDALIDHIEDGAHGAMFVAALLSAAFVEAEPKHLLDAAEAVLPPRQPGRSAVESVRQGRPGQVGVGECARRVAEAYGHPNYSQAPQNAAYIAMGWLCGETPEDRLARTVSSADRRRSRPRFWGRSWASWRGQPARRRGWRLRRGQSRPILMLIWTPRR